MDLELLFNVLFNLLFNTFFIVFSIVLFIVLLLYILNGFCRMKLFKDVYGMQDSWTAWLPVYNYIIILQKTFGEKWWLFFVAYLLYLIPIIGHLAAILISIYVNISFVKTLNKPLWWGILLAFFDKIAFPIFVLTNKLKYLGPLDLEMNFKDKQNFEE